MNQAPTEEKTRAASADPTNSAEHLGLFWIGTKAELKVNVQNLGSFRHITGRLFGMVLHHLCSIKLSHGS